MNKRLQLQMHGHGSLEVLYAMLVFHMTLSLPLSSLKQCMYHIYHNAIVPCQLAGLNWPGVRTLLAKVASKEFLGGEVDCLSHS